MQTAVDQPLVSVLDHNAKPKHVLCYGHDFILLQSRQRILELAGCPTEIAGDFRTFRDSLRSRCPGVLTLCQTLSVEELFQAASLALEQCPGMPLLLMYIQHQKIFPSQTYHFMQTLEGPRAFAATVFRMLYQSGEMQTGSIMH